MSFRSTMAAAVSAAPIAAGTAALTVPANDAQADILTYTFEITGSDLPEIQFGDTGSIVIDISEGTNLGIQGQFLSVDSINSVIVTFDNGMADSVLTMDSGLARARNNVFDMDGYVLDFQATDFTDRVASFGTVTEFNIDVRGPEHILNPMNGTSLEYGDIFNSTAIGHPDWSNSGFFIAVGPFGILAEFTSAQIVPAPASAAAFGALGLWGSRRRRDADSSEVSATAGHAKDDHDDNRPAFEIT